MSQDSTVKWMVGTAVLTLATTKVIEHLYNQYRANKNLSKSACSEVDAPSSSRGREDRKYGDELYREQLARNYAFLGEKGMESLKNQYFIVVGAGGVGSWVVTMLVRAGCTKIKVIDFDQVSLSSLNRHSCANVYDVGLSKVEVLRSHMLKIAPWCEIHAVNELWNKENAERLIYGEDGCERPTFVIDCIDNIDTKIDLLEYVYKKKIPLIASMGAATKSDPTRINVGDLSATEEDPLARSIRRRLKQRGIISGIPVVFSAEKPDPKKAKLLPLPEEEFQKGKVDELTPLRDFRVRVLPVLTTMPGVFGLTIASWVICKIAGYPMEPIEGKNRIKIYDGIYHSLVSQMSRIGTREQCIPISVGDVAYVVEEVFRGKSPVSGFSTRLVLSKWDPSKPVSMQNVVVLTKEEQAAHEVRVLNGSEKLEDVYPEAVLELVNQRFEEERYYSKFR